MQFWGSFGVVAVLSLVHLTVDKWRVLRGPNGHVWLSVSAGTALAYVFAYLLPKLGSIQATLIAPVGSTQTFLRNHVYLIALAGLLIYFALGSSDEPTPSNRRGIGPSYSVLLQLVGYSFYSLQLGYLAADLPEPALSSYLLVALILGIHLMGIDYHLSRRHPAPYRRLLRYAYTAALFVGWAGGIATTVLESTVMFSSTFVAGAIIITAIREELPGRGQPKPIAFFLATVVACAAILTVQALQDG